MLETFFQCKVEYQSFALNCTCTNVVFFTRGVHDVLVLSLTDKKSSKCKVAQNIVRIAWANNNLIIVCDILILVYDPFRRLVIKSYGHRNCKMALGNSSSGLVIYRKNYLRNLLTGAEASKVCYARVINNELIVCARKGSLVVFDATLRKLCKKIVKEIAEDFYVEIYKKKVYMLNNGNITGHDLCLTIDLPNVRINRFSITCMYVLLHSQDAGLLYVYNKSLDKQLFIVKAQSYEYDCINKRIFCIESGIFRVLEFESLRNQFFEFIDQNVEYIEEEDEFDRSDSTFADFSFW